MDLPKGPSWKVIQCSYCSIGSSYLAAFLGRAVGPRARVVVSPVPAATRPVDEGIVAGTKTFPLL